MSSAAYIRTVNYNAGHLILGTDAPEEQKWRGAVSLAQRFVDWEHYWHAFVTLRLTLPLALLVVAVWVVRRVRDGLSFSPFQRIVSGWLGCALFAMMVIAKSELRFWTLCVPPSALLAGAALDSIPQWLSRFEARPLVQRANRLLLPAAVAALIAINAYGLWKPLFRPKYTLRDAALRLEKHLGERDVVIVGLASPQVVLGTPYRNFYVRDAFNSTRAALKRLNVRYVLFVDGYDPSRTVFDREFPGLRKALSPELILEFRGMRHRLYPVGRRLELYPDDARVAKPKSPTKS
jgi:hypothetical protein